MLPDLPDRLARYAERRGLPLPQPPYDAVALGLREQDLLVLAGLPVPEELAPLDSRIGHVLSSLVQDFLELPAAERSELLDRLRSLPQHERTTPPRRPYPDRFGPGGLLLGLLDNRNLRSAAAPILHLLDGPGLSGVTVHGFGNGRTGMTTEALNGLAVMVGLPRDDLAVLVGLPTPAEPAPPVPPAHADTAELLWVCRGLTYEQIDAEYQRIRRPGA
ncbi:hypothetical protein ACGFX4_28725 [Kitasatospora sp. NPDC048365]|uniref:hypothetical protein n=1 Tax=Kitasatospora sp. NPDC048365 TaxID=3364050 RepID=UPI003717E441